MRRLLLALALVGCGHKEDSKPAPTTTGSGSAVVAAPGVEVFVDDTSIAHVATSQIATWPRLDTLVPVTARHLGSWQELSITGSAETKQLHKPADQYRDLVPVLYPGDGGKPAFGMFDPVELANHGKPKVGTTDVTEIRIILASGGGRGENESGDGGGQDPEKLSIAIKTPAGESTLDGPKLLAITREPLPGDDSKELRGWSLKTLLDAAGIKKFQKLMLTDVSGQALSLEPADLDPATSIPFVKLNRQGSLRVTVFKKQGEGWTRGGGLRGLVSIEVLK